MTEPMKLRVRGWLHTGKQDRDDGSSVGRNASRKRTMRAFKRSHRRETFNEALRELED